MSMFSLFNETEKKEETEEQKKYREYNNAIYTHNKWLEENTVSTFEIEEEYRTYSEPHDPGDTDWKIETRKKTMRKMRDGSIREW